MLELVTVSVRFRDYEHLRERSPAIDEQVSLALTNYLKLLRDGKLPKSALDNMAPDGELKNTRCALLKSLYEQIREIEGRFDLHTLEAVRLYLP